MKKIIALLPAIIAAPLFIDWQPPTVYRPFSLRAQMLMGISSFTPATSGGSTITFTNASQAHGSGTSSTATISSLDCTGANFYTIVTSMATTATPSDGSGHTFSGGTAYTNSASGGKVKIWYVANVTGSATESFAVTSDFPSIAAACFANVKTSSPFDVANGLSDASIGTAFSGSVTPNFANELFIAGENDYFNFSTASTVDSGFTRAATITANSAPYYGIGLGYKIKTNSTAENPAWTNSGASGAVTQSTFQHN